MWFLPWMTLWRVTNRLRAIAEHGGMERSKDRRRTTHSVRQHLAARFLMVPYNIGWHLAHHVDMGVPWKHLPAYHRELVASGWVPEGLEYRNYPALWRKLGSGADVVRQAAIEAELASEFEQSPAARRGGGHRVGGRSARRVGRALLVGLARAPGPWWPAPSSGACAWGCGWSWWRPPMGSTSADGASSSRSSGGSALRWAPTDPTSRAPRRPRATTPRPGP